MSRLGPVARYADPASFLVEARARIDSYQRGTDGSGSLTAHLYSATVDNTLRALHAELAGELPAEWLDEDICIIAVGGYGRRELCPWSDVDLLFVTRGGAHVPVYAERVLYPLWDARLQVGHAAGTVEQILQQADGDLTRQTALLEIRHVAGSRSLWSELGAGLEARLPRWREGLLARVRPENLTRFARYGQSVFLLEPQVKEGKGGLRDLHWLLWIYRIEEGLRGTQDLLLSGLVEPDHHRAMLEAYEFLLRVRIQLHVLKGRAQDHLTFEYQEPVARALGFRAAGGLKAVERFMGAYYRHAYALAHHVGLYVARKLGFYWDEPDQPSTELLLGPSAPHTTGGADRLSEDGRWELRDGSVRCLDPALLARDPLAILDLFAFLQKARARLHHDTLEHVRSAARRVDARFRRKPEATRRFRALLEGGDVFRTLVAMHRAGVLGRLLPEFGACFCQAQHNRVHLYTVDVHCLYVVRELETLERPEVAGTAQLFSEAFLRREQRGPLILAALLHDVAKAHGPAHSRVGAEMARKALRRLGYPDEDVERVGWLILHHLTLSELAVHRDLSDPGTLARLRAVIPSREALDDLLALTWADTRGTNPKLLTSWRQAVLEQGYRAALRAIGEVGFETPAPEAVRARVEALLEAEVGHKRAPALAERLFADPSTEQAAIDQDRPPEELAALAILIDQLDAALEHMADDSSAFVTSVRHLEGERATQWTVCALDRPGLFSELTGALTALGLTIASAEALSRQDGVVIDTFTVTDAEGRAVVEQRRWTRLERLLRRARRGELDLEDEVAGAVRRARKPKDPGAMQARRVTVRNEEGSRATLVDVVTPDQPGLVHTIARMLHEADLDLRAARIATRMDLASDTFWVLDRRGRRLGERRRRRLARVLQDAFGGVREDA